MKHKQEVYLDLDGTEVVAGIVVTSWGCGPTMPSWNYAGDPGEPPEWYVDWIEVNGVFLAPWAYMPFWQALYTEFILIRQPIRTNPRWQELSDYVDQFLNDNPEEFEYPEPDDYDDYDPRDWRD